jgi:hypothetical protein
MESIHERCSASAVLTTKEWLTTLAHVSVDGVTVAAALRRATNWMHPWRIARITLPPLSCQRKARGHVVGGRHWSLSTA